ncbi:MAG: HAD-IIA family hydrolase [Lentisphaerae bacterium]|jgi:HAD superfamily hydrolase (TIGR01450 family)|nr:HAD-IIA family hydrolase [Lentisphaerota bacterium]MBT5610280.1 HAD-IIA family hydrolase [Lentisphaerota bacterium]MBT7059182.1 HAD-IIA family hydrolase [Lentisphaerota bacterium]MBT7848200.1 HAD-IIA family hydrolase [Lentisphaerota bacterium]
MSTDPDAVPVTDPVGLLSQGHRSPEPDCPEDRSAVGAVPQGTYRLMDWLEENQSQVDALVLDIDGVLMIDHGPTAGSRALIAWLRDMALPFVLLTNDGCNSPSQKAEALAQCGVDVLASELVSASHGLVDLVDSRGWRGHRFFVMGELGQPSFVAEAGLVPIDDLAQLDACFGVAIGEKHYDWHATITAVFNFLLKQPHAPLVVPNPDLYFPISDNRLHLASGAVASFLASLCESRGRQLLPIYLGKPHAPIFQHAHRVLEAQASRRIAPGRVMIVGDSLASDMEGGASFGYRTGLMMGGITTAQHLDRAARQPDVVFSRI